MPTATDTIAAARAAGETCSRCGGEIRYDQTRSKRAPRVDHLMGLTAGLDVAVAHRGCYDDHGVDLQALAVERQKLAAVTRGAVELTPKHRSKQAGRWTTAM